MNEGFNRGGMTLRSSNYIPCRGSPGGGVGILSESDSEISSDV